MNFYFKCYNTIFKKHLIKDNNILSIQLKCMHNYDWYFLYLVFKWNYYIQQLAVSN